MKIALAQMFCDWGKVKANLRRSERLIRRAARSGAELVVFPEMSVHGMWKNHLLRLAAEPLDGPIVQRMRAWARRHRIAIGFGFAEKTAAKPYNCYVVLDRRGTIAGVYRKNFITVLEKDYLRPDTRRPIFRLGKLRVAVSTCADCHRRQPLESYCRRGVDLVLMPHAWDADPVLKGGKIAVWRNEEHMVDAVARRRVVRYRTHDEMLKFFVEALRPKAVAGGFYAAFVNPVGRSHPLIPFVGPAFVLDPSGRVIARSRSQREALILAEWDCYT
jgi:predicted amidohydrolase